MAAENALTHDLAYGDDIERVWSEKDGDRCELQTVAAGTVSVDFMDEAAVDAAQVKYGRSLMHDAPNIEVTIGGNKHALTWQEAYNLAEMLTRTVNVALYG